MKIKILLLIAMYNILSCSSEEIFLSNNTYFYKDMYRNDYIIKMSITDNDTIISGDKYHYYAEILDGAWCYWDTIGQLWGYRITPDTVYYFERKDDDDYKERIFPSGKFKIFVFEGLSNGSEWEIAHKKLIYKAKLLDKRDAVFTPYRFFHNAYHIYFDGMNIKDADVEYWIVPSVGIVRIDSKVYDFRLTDIK